jgi:ectoine hydroxylase-related dioxygenase (phytanoyl-CoA dioxygenase family)
METATLENPTYTPEQIEYYAHEMKTNGHFIIENVLSPEELAEARAALDAIFELEVDLGKERGWHTPLYLVAYMLPQKHPFFRQLPLHPKVLPLMRRILGPRVVITSLNGFTMAPGSKNQALHLDQPESVPGYVVNINSMFCLDDFTIENGATRIVPRSHDRVFDHSIDPSTFEGETVRLTAPAGSLVSFNGGLWHAGSANTTTGYRRALHAYYSKPWVQPQWDFTRSLSQDVIDILTDEQRRIYGIGRRTNFYDNEKNAIPPRRSVD